MKHFLHLFFIICILQYLEKLPDWCPESGKVCYLPRCQQINSVIRYEWQKLFIHITKHIWQLSWTIPFLCSEIYCNRNHRYQLILFCKSREKFIRSCDILFPAVLFGCFLYLIAICHDIIKHVFYRNGIVYIRLIFYSYQDNVWFAGIFNAGIFEDVPKLLHRYDLFVKP